MSTEKRVHDNLRLLVDQACVGVTPHVSGLIKDAARRAYYLGCADGARFIKERDKEQTEGEAT